MPLLIASPHVQTEAPSRRTRLCPCSQVGQGRVATAAFCPMLRPRRLRAEESWPGWPPRSGCRRPSAGGCSPARPTPPTSCRKRQRIEHICVPTRGKLALSREGKQRERTGAQESPVGWGRSCCVPPRLALSSQRSPSRRGGRAMPGGERGSGSGSSSTPTCSLGSSSSRSSHPPGWCHSPRPASRGSPGGCKTCC